MDGIHDLGGKQGFDQIRYPTPPHEETWEPVVRALNAYALKKRHYNMDEFRHAIERMAPRHYLSAPYFERHLTAVATLLVEKGMVTKEELEALVPGQFPLSGPIGKGRLPSPPQSFAIGESVRVKNEFVPGHVRMPAYIRGKRGASALRMTKSRPSDRHDKSTGERDRARGTKFSKSPDSAMFRVLCSIQAAKSRCHTTKTHRRHRAPPNAVPRYLSLRTTTTGPEGRILIGRCVPWRKGRFKILVSHQNAPMVGGRAAGRRQH